MTTTKYHPFCMRYGNFISTIIASGLISVSYHPLRDDINVVSHPPSPPPPRADTDIDVFLYFFVFFTFYIFYTFSRVFPDVT